MNRGRLLVDVAEVLDALRSIPPQTDLAACGLILTYDEDADEQIANVALVLSYETWTEDATRACDAARASAWTALAPLNVIPNLLCRTRAEHEEFSKTEPQWLPIRDGDC